MTVSGISVFSGKPVELSISDGRISAVRTPAHGEVDEHVYVSPGFLDMQVNGYGGFDYSLDDLDEDGIRAIVRDLAGSGATQQVATVVTGPQERLLRNLALIAETAQRDPCVRAAVPAVHLEGPFISEEDGPRGAHDRLFVRDPDIAEYREWADAAGGLLRIVTLAPERRGAIDFIEKVSADGVIVAIGHSGAEPEVIRRAVSAGARLSTHLGNGSHAMIPRLSNYIWEQLAADELYMGIIPDGFHLPPAVMKSFVRAKGLDRTILVSDVALYGGMKPGAYDWGNVRVRVHEDGHLGVDGTPYLAGAGHLLDWSLVQFMRAVGTELGETVKLCTQNPARLLGLEPKFGTLEQNAPAHLVTFAFAEESERLSMRDVIRDGAPIYRDGAPLA